MAKGKTSKQKNEAVVQREALSNPKTSFALQRPMPIGYTIFQRAKLREFEKRVLESQK